jgi:hypothetical protein
MATIVQMRRGTAAAWTAANTLLAEGEWGLETDTKFYKIGDGSTVWNSLSYSQQSITFSGDLTGSGTTTISLVLNNSGVTAGIYNNSATTVTPFTVDVKGRVTGTGTPVTIAPAFSSITGKPSTLSGYGITDALSNNVPLATTATATTIAERDSSGNLTANEFIGSGAGLTSNTVPVGSLATTGTPSATTFLNGVGAFITPVSGFSRIAVADVNYTITVTTATILAYSSITAARTLTLPAATTQGQLIWIVDESGSLSSSIYLTIQHAGTDTIEGQTSFVLTGQYAAICLASNGSGKWIVLTYEEIPLAVADANYTIPYREDCIVQMNSLTAGRTVTLPSCVTSGQRVTIMDFSGAASASKIITVAPAGADTINGSTSPYLINSAYGQIVLVGNGSGKWSYSVALSNINLGTSFTEYAYNTSTTTTSDSTSFGYGSGGAASQAFAPTGENSVNKSFQFLQPIQPTDLITLEFNISGYGWLPVEYTQVGFGFNPSSSTFFGAFLGITSSSGGYAGFCNTANPTTTWATVILNNPNIRWRVRKTSQGNFAQGSPSYSTTIGNASATSFTITHNLGTPIYSVTAWETTGSLRQITSGIVISNPTSTTVTLTFTTAPALNAVQVLVQSNGGTVSNNDRLSNLANPELTISAAATASTAQWNRCYATSAAYALTLPPVLASAGKIVGVRIDSSSTYNVTVTGPLDGGATTYIMIPGECAEFKADGATWQRISNNTVDGSWVPVPASLTVVGTPTYLGKFKKSGNLITFGITFVASTSVSFSMSTSFSLPILPVMYSTLVVSDMSTPSAVGTGAIGVNGQAFICNTANASTKFYAISGSYFCG